MSDLYRIKLAGVSLPYSLLFPANGYFAAFATDAAPDRDVPVCVSEADWAYYRKKGFLENAHVEYSLLTAHFSDALMEFDRLIIHGVAIRWRDAAWLICGPSGVGKSTQARTLQELRPGEFSIICGDRPILQVCPCLPSPVCQSERSEESASPVILDTILVHPSPWNGKENWHGAEAAPLVGLILLNRGEENRLVMLNPREAAVPVYTQVIQTCVTEDGIRKAAELVTRLLNAVPIWKLTSHQVPDSTKLLLDTVF